MGKKRTTISANTITRHHMKPQSRGGTSHPKNILHIKWRKHKAIHHLFHNTSWGEIMSYLRAEMQGKKTPLSNWHSDKHWKIVFGDKNLEEAYNLMRRVRRAKNVSQ